MKVFFLIIKSKSANSHKIFVQKSYIILLETVLMNNTNLFYDHFSLLIIFFFKIR